MLPGYFGIELSGGYFETCYLGFFVKCYRVFIWNVLYLGYCSIVQHSVMLLQKGEGILSQAEMAIMCSAMLHL